MSYTGNTHNGHDNGNGSGNVVQRLDRLDEKIWTTARHTDDPHVAVRAARDFADRVFVGIILGAGSGQHRLNCSVSTDVGTVTAPANMPMSVLADIRTIALPGDRSDNEICELIALAHVGGAPTVIVLRTADLDCPSFEQADDCLVRGWQIVQGRCEPLDAAGVFAVCCSESLGGGPLPIHPGTRYADAYPLVRFPRPGRGGDDDSDDGKGGLATCDA